MHPSDSVCYFCAVFCALGCNGDDISDQDTYYLNVKADVRAQNHYRCSSTTIPVPASIPQSARWSAMDELAIQHFAWPKAKCKPSGSVTTSGQHATQCTSKAPAYYKPRLQCFFATVSAATDEFQRSFSRSQTPTSKAHFATKTEPRASGLSKTLLFPRSNKR